jgi:hypothetical protein
VRGLDRVFWVKTIYARMNGAELCNGLIETIDCRAQSVTLVKYPA